MWIHYYTVKWERQIKKKNKKTVSRSNPNLQTRNMCEKQISDRVHPKMLIIVNSEHCKG